MANNRYIDDDGEPRYGQRVSPEELDRIRRAQGIEPPMSTSERGEGRGWGDSETSSPRSWGQSPRRMRADDGVDPYRLTAQAAPSDSDDSHRGGVSVDRPADGWSWQREQDTRTRPRRRWRMLVIGLILLIVVPLALGMGAMMMVMKGSVGSGSVLSESGEVYLDAGAEIGLYSSHPSTDTSQCTLTAPSGQDVPLTSLADLLNMEPAPSRTLAYATATVPDVGTYTVACPGGTRDVIVGPALNPDRILPASGMILAASVSALIGLGLSIAGLVRLIRSR